MLVKLPPMERHEIVELLGVLDPKVQQVALKEGNTHTVLVVREESLNIVHKTLVVAGYAMNNRVLTAPNETHTIMIVAWESVQVADLPQVKLAVEIM